MKAEGIAQIDLLKSICTNAFNKDTSFDKYNNDNQVMHKRKLILIRNIVPIEKKNLSPDKLIRIDSNYRRHTNKYSNNNSKLVNYYFKLGDKVCLSYISLIMILIPILFINPIMYTVIHSLAFFFIYYFFKSKREETRDIYLYNKYIKLKKTTIKELCLKYGLLTCINSNPHLEIIDKTISKKTYTEMREIHEKQIHFIIEIVGLIKFGKIKMLSSQFNIVREISENFRTKGGKKINGNSLYKEFNKYYNMNEEELLSLYKNILFRRID